MTDDLKEAVERLELIRFQVESMVCASDEAHTVYPDPASVVDAIERVLSALKAAERPQPLPGDGEGVKAAFDPANNTADDLLRRGDVVALLDARAKECADLALSGDADNSRGREAMEAAFSRALYAVAFMPAALSRVSTPGREELQYSVSSRAEARTAFPVDTQANCVTSSGGGSERSLAEQLCLPEPESDWIGLLWHALDFARGDETPACKSLHVENAMAALAAHVARQRTAGEDVDAAKVPRDGEAQRPHSDLETVIRDRDALKAERDALREGRTYTQAEVDSLLRAAYPFATTAERARILTGGHKP